MYVSLFFKFRNQNLFFVLLVMAFSKSARQKLLFLKQILTNPEPGETYNK